MKMNALKAMGAALYWAEGTKMRIDNRGWKQYHVVFTNTNPEMIKAFLRFLKNLKTDKTRVKVQLHLYPEHNAKEEISFWSEITKIPEKQFEKIIYAKGTGSRKKSKHGICAIRYYSKSAYLKIEKLINSLPK
jgi:hypothetical protein